VGALASPCAPHSPFTSGAVAIVIMKGQKIRARSSVLRLDLP
jgi:hypothetical protein